MAGLFVRPVGVLCSVCLSVQIAMVPRASADFDIVGVYHERVKRFEAIYYLSEDAAWHRDRRVFELFGNLDGIESQGETGTSTTLSAQSWGMLLNIRPHKRSDAQLSFFSLQHRADFQLQSALFEALHGARLTVSDYAEISVGSYWQGSGGFMDGSVFMELNSPRFFAKSSYVVGMGDNDTSVGDGVQALKDLLRWDLRFPFDQWKYADLLEAGIIAYNFTGKRDFVLNFELERLRAPGVPWLGLTGDVAYSLTQKKLVQAAVGLELLIQPDADFNLTRRGHFGTSYGLKALFRTGIPSALRVFSAETDFPSEWEGQSDKRINGYDVTAHIQVPAKWVWTAIVVVASAAAAEQAKNEGDQAAAKRHRDFGAGVLRDTLNEPRDILFCRLGFSFSHNDISSYDLLPEPVPRNRFIAHMSLVY